MAKRALGLLAVVVCTGVVGVAGPAVADPVTVQSGSASCSAMLTVTPTDIVWAPTHQGDWWEDGSVTEVGSCEPGATDPVLATGSWQRVGGSRDSVTGECPGASFSLQDARTGRWTYYYEMTAESGRDTFQVIGIDPFYTPPIPLFYDSFFLTLPAGGALLAKTDPVACAAWPTGPSEAPPFQIPGPPPFHIELDGKLPAATSLLQACLTVQGLLPRTCLNA